MTVENSAPETTNETPQPIAISTPNISFTDYEKLRRGEVVTPEPKESAPADQAEQKPAAKSEPAESEEQDSETTDEDSSEDGSTESKDDEKPKKPGGFQKKINKLTARVAQATQRAELLEAMLAKQNAAQGTNEIKPDSKPVATEGKPNPDKYETHAEYVEALTDWKLEQKLSENSKKDEVKKLQNAQAELANAYNERAKAFSEKNPDFNDVIAEVEFPVSLTVKEILLSSENGPELAYELAKNPEEFERVCKLPPLAAAREIGKLESRIASKASESKTKEQKITKAPKPLDPISGGQAPASKKKLEEMNFAEYEKARRDQMKRRA